MHIATDMIHGAELGKTPPPCPFRPDPRLLPPPPDAGFTLIELVMIIILLGVLSVTALVRWPAGLDNRAATLEMIRGIRYAQHLAMTREYVQGDPWGVVINANRYSIRNPATEAAPPEFVNRSLLDDAATTIAVAPADTALCFNGLGEPIALDGTPRATSVTYTINNTSTITVCPETGYVVEGPACPGT